MQRILVVLTVVLTITACSKNSDKIDGPTPVLTAVEPNLLCVEQAEKQVVLTGDGIAPLIIDAAKEGRARVILPQIFLIPTKDLEGNPPDSSAEVSIPTDDLVWHSQQSMEFTLKPSMGLAAGVYDLRLQNGSGQETILADALTIVPPPQVTDVTPDVLCREQQGVDLTLTGSGFLQVGDALPTLFVDGAEITAQPLGSCIDIAGTNPAARTCSTAVFTLPQAAGSVGWQDVTIRNPAPADCEFTIEDAFYSAAAPQIAIVGPTAACDHNPTDFTIEGSDFLVLSGEQPVVTIADQSAVITDMSGCNPIENLANAELCTTIEARITTGLPLGDYLVTVQNPGEGACQDSYTGTLGPPPVVSSVTPLQICASGGTITVNGENFVDGATVALGMGALVIDAEQTTFIDDTTLEAFFAAGLDPGLYDIIVTNPDGCTGTLEDGLDVTPVPVVYFVDPSTIYNGVNMQVTVYVSGILGDVEDVSIYPTGQPADATSLVISNPDPNRIQAVVPAGLAAGAYDVMVSDDLGCLGTLESGIVIVEDLTVAIEKVELPFGWTDARTGVNIYSPVDPGVDMVNFQPIPRFYLNPENASGDTLASELKHTAFVTETRCSATVPAELPVGIYDLIALNPDGTVGLLPQAFRVTALPPPVITDILPASVENQDVQTITVLGANFRTPEFEATCYQPDDSQVTITGTVDTDISDDKSLSVDIDFITQTVQHRSLCIIKVTNPDDSTYATFSALGVTNPSLNLDHFAAATEMTTARRAACAVSGDATPGARFVYAIGGDNGLTQDSTDDPAFTYYASLEMAAVDPYGELGEWSELPYSLPEARSFHSCTRIGRYAYVLGGNDGSGAQNTVWRAKILDPNQSPEIEDVRLDLDLEQFALLLPGRYSYRVSALRASDDADNPDGETLASDPLLIQTPDIEQKISITISWTEVAGAVGYRIYRTPEPDQPFGNETLLGQVDGATRMFVDDGSVTPGQEKPLPLGAMGQFAVMTSLNSNREGAGIAVASDPSDATIKYIYAVGGRDETLAGLDTTERLQVDIQADGTHSVASQWVTSAAAGNIGSARWQLRAYVADDVSAPVLGASGETWIYAVGGLRPDLVDKINEVVALKVEAGGALGEGVDCRWDVDGMQPFNAGYVGFLLNHQLFAFGGNQGAGTDPSTESYSIEMCGIRPGACDGNIPDPPDLANWNNVGINLSSARYLHAGVTASAFVFLVGGVSFDQDFQKVVTTSTGKTLW
jgi:large repetitive protein